MWKLFKRNPLRLFSFLFGWIESLYYVNESNNRFPIILETPGLSIRFKKRKLGKLIINGTLIVERRGAPKPYGNVVVEIYDGGTLIINGTVILGANVSLLVGPGATMILGSKKDGYTTISHSTHIMANKHVEIGSGSMISWDVLIMDTNMHSIIDPPTFPHEPVIVGEHVWLCCRSVILKGVTIGNDAIVGAAAVVTKDVPPKTAVGGNPAKAIKENVIWQE
jgi:carbonic anhydrase/acetyltransferase-like protein (isoleucine patch superfamily)